MNNATLTLANGKSFTVQIVEPMGRQYTPSNDMVVEKKLADAQALSLPIPLGVRVIGSAA